MSTYESFIASKRIESPSAGVAVAEDSINPDLYDFQREIVRWALRRGRAAIFADCGLGKTPMQIEWARHVAGDGGRVLIVAPLAVSGQTVLEGEKFGVPVVHAHDGSEALSPGIYVTNYERLHRFRPDGWSGIVLDESSILKSYEGHYRQRLTEFSAGIGYRLCCTATPAPNDTTELINHSEFLGILTGKEILALFFRQDGNTTHAWRLKGHAEDEFWKWLASWSVALRSPADLGFDGSLFALPDLLIDEHVVARGRALPGMLFSVEARGLAERREARKDSLEDRVARAAEIVESEPDEQWLLWCNLNAESSALARAIPGSVEVTGSDPEDHKEAALIGFARGDVRILITKPTIAGFGLNWQGCSRMIFVGLSDSYEQFYQALRRCWRFGQKRPVVAHIVIGEAEGSVKDNIERKERQASKMFEQIVRHMSLYQMDRSERQEVSVESELAGDDEWTMHLGDSYYVTDEIDSDSVGLAVFSPPFPAMYAYTNSPHDLGNTRSLSEMVEHFRWFIGRDKLLRVLKPGRHCCIHLTQIPAFKWIDGYIGVKDFRGAVIGMMEDEGWIYYGEVCIDKDPQVKAIRTKDRGLLFKTLATDAAHLHPALADYLLQFRKPGDNPEPIRAGSSEKYNNADGWVSPEQWIEWAHPVWYAAREGLPGGIRETDVLNVAVARDAKDERHLCPLQLGVIERAVMLWSNPGDLVFSPFAGIGSEGVGALRHDRRFVGAEIRRSYWETACRNLEEVAKGGRRQLRIEAT